MSLLTLAAAVRCLLLLPVPWPDDEVLPELHPRLLDRAELSDLCILEFFLDCSVLALPGGGDVVFGDVLGAVPIRVAPDSVTLIAIASDSLTVRT